jgi:hypothetical protein
MCIAPSVDVVELPEATVRAFNRVQVVKRQGGCLLPPRRRSGGSRGRVETATAGHRGRRRVAGPAAGMAACDARDE